MERIYEIDTTKLMTEPIEREEIVRCRDCTSSFISDTQVFMCSTPCGDSLHGSTYASPNGFCAWGNRVEFVTCKCGQDIEAVGEMQVCPSCGRKVYA